MSGNDNKIIESAEFNPRIKVYIFVVVGCILLISIIGFPVFLFWLLGLGKSFSNRYYKSLSCTLTQKHLEFKKGVLFKIEKTIPLENIQDLAFIDNPFLRIFELRILKIETAGNSNPHGTDMKLIGILGTHQFKDKVLKQRDILKNEGKDVHSGSDGKSTQLLTEIRDLLVAIKDQNQGNISSN